MWPFLHHIKMRKKKVVFDLFIAFSPLCDETSLDANEHIRFIKFVIEDLLTLKMEDIIVITDDNCEVNKAKGRKLNIPLVGCASRRFNLAVNLLLSEHKQVLDKVNNLMGKFKKLKYGAKLRSYTPLAPVQRNVTRWSSTAQMVNRYFEMKQFLWSFENCLDLMDFFPTTREKAELEELKSILTKLDSVTKVLQGK